MPIGLYNLRYHRTPQILLNLAVDGTHTRSSSGSFLSGPISSLNLRWAGPDQRRFEDRGDGHGARYLSEGSRSNFVKNNRDLNSAVWTGGGAGSAFFENDAVSVDSVTEADRIYASATFGIYQSYTLTSGSTYAVSIFLRSPAGSGTLNYQMALQHGNVAGTGTYITGASTESYQRVEFVSTTNIATNHLVLAEGRGVGPLTQSIVNAIYDLPQVELGRYPTSAISSSAGGSVRAGDLLSIPSASYQAIINEMATRGFEFDIFPCHSSADLVSGDIEIIFSFTGYTGASYVGIVNSLGATRVRLASSGTVKVTSNAITYSRHEKFTIKVFPTYNGGADCAVEISGATAGNGVTVQTGGVFAFPTGTLTIGAQANGTFPYNGRISDVRRI